MIIYSMILNKQTTLFLFNIKTMVRRSIKQFVKENYVLDFTVQGSCNGKDYKDVPVNVYRPKLMKELPEEMKEYVTGVSLGCYDDRGYPSWDCGNPDYGRWDAFCVFRYLAGIAQARQSGTFLIHQRVGRYMLRVHLHESIQSLSQRFHSLAWKPEHQVQAYIGEKRPEYAVRFDGSGGVVTSSNELQFRIYQ